MKRSLTALCSVIGLLLATALSISAARASIAWNSVRPKALYVQNGMTLSSVINPDFSAQWPEFDIPEAGTTAACTVNMRGFALSPDGHYTYMGIQHGGGDMVRGMYVMETMTGKITDFVCRYDGDTCDGTRPHFSYPKGIAADTRGYVYVGYTLSTSYNAAYLVIYRQNSDGTLVAVSETPLCSLGEAGDPFGTKVGINGVTVRELDGKTYAYVVTNYDHDTLCRIDVTDPLNPVFSVDSTYVSSIDLNSLVDNKFEEAYYLDVAEDGTIYLALSKSDADGIAVITPDGRTCRKFIPQSGVYSVLIYGDYLLCGARTGGQITVLDRTTGKSVGTLSVLDTYGERITRMQIANDVLFICDAGSIEGVANAIYVAPLSAAGKTHLEAIVRAQNTGIIESESVFESIPESEAPTDSTEPVGSTMESASVSEVPSETDTPANSSVSVKVGCASIVGPESGLLSVSTVSAVTAVTAVAILSKRKKS